MYYLFVYHRQNYQKKSNPEHGDQFEKKNK